jgi:hypothetical protein
MAKSKTDTVAVRRNDAGEWAWERKSKSDKAVSKSKSTFENQALALSDAMTQNPDFPYGTIPVFE